MKNPIRFGRRITACVFTIGAGTLYAADFTWDGGSTFNDNWSSGTNWNPTGAPPNNGSADLIFSGSTRTTPNAEVPYALNTIRFSSTSASFTLGGSALTLQTNSAVAPFIRNSSARAHTVNNALTFSNAGTLDADTNNLTLGGSIANGGNTLTLNAELSRTLTLSSSLSGSGSVQKTGGGLCVLSGNNTYSGITTISAGTLSIDLDQRLGSAPASFTAGKLAVNGGTLRTTNASARDLHANRGVTLTSLGTFDVQGAGAFKILPVIAGTGRLVKTGPGTLRPSAINTYSGGTTVNQGILEIAEDRNLGAAPGTFSNQNIILDGGTLASTAGFTIHSNRALLLGNGGGTLSVAADTTLVFNSVASGGSLIKDGAGTLSMTETSNSYSGSTTILAGNIQIGGDSSLGSPPASPTPSHLIFDGGSLVYASPFTLATLHANRGILLQSGGGGISTTSSGHNLSYSGIIAGTGNLALGGPGTITLGGASTFTGRTLIGPGTKVSINGDNRLGAAPSFLADRLTLDQATLTITAETIMPVNRGVRLDSGGGTFQLTNPLTINGVISGTGALTRNGSGTLTPTANNTYTGKTTVSGGGIRISSDANLGAAPASPTLGHLALNLGSLESTANLTLHANRGVSLSSFCYLNPQAGTTLTCAGTVSGTGDLLVDGEGVLALTGNNTYTGLTAILTGALSINSDARLGTPPATPTPFHFQISGGSLLQATGTFTLDSRRGISLTDNGSGNPIIDVPNAAHTLTAGAIIAGTGGLDKFGAGTLSLSGNNTYQGVTAVIEGTLKALSSSALGTTGSGTLVNAATLSLGNPSAAISIAEPITLEFGSLIKEGALAVDVTGPVAVSESATIRNFDSSSLNPLTFSGGIALEGDLSIQGGHVTVAGGLSGAGGADGISILGGTINLGGINTFAGPVDVQSGTLNVTHASALGTITQGVVAKFGGKLSIATGITVVNEPLTMEDASRLELKASSAWSGSTPIHLTAAAVPSIRTIELHANASVDGGGAITGNLDNTSSFELHVPEVSSVALVDRPITLGSGELRITGSGTILLNSPLQQARVTLIRSGATLRTTAHSLFSSTIPLTVEGGATFDVNGFQQTIGSLIGSTGQILLGNGTLECNQSTETTFGGTITGLGTLVKKGTAKLTLTNAPTVIHTLSVEEGILRLGNAELYNLATVRLKTGGTLELGHSLVDYIDHLYINDVQQAPGTWGAIGNATADFTTPLITGDGLLYVQEGPISETYETWIAGYYAEGPDRAFGADPDDDGISNGIEFVIGAIPRADLESAADSLAKLPIFARVGNNFQFVYRRTQRSSYLNPFVEHSPDLTGWAVATDGVGGVSQQTVSFDAFTDVITVTIPLPLSMPANTPAERYFGRLAVSQPGQ